MENMLERVKWRLAQPGSPIRTVKGVANAIDMSESGFYRMLERHTYKKSTLLALADALGVKESFLLGESDFNTEVTDEKYPHGLSEILSEIKILREQLQAKDRQIESKDRQIELRDAQISGLLKTVDALVGKSEGAIFQPLLSADTDDFQRAKAAYVSAVVQKCVIPLLEEMN